MVLHFCVWQTPRIPLLICFIRHYRESFCMLDIVEKHINRLYCRHTQNMSSPCDFQTTKWNRSTLSIRLALTNTTFHFDTRTSECTISKRWARWLHLIRAAICICVRVCAFACISTCIFTAWSKKACKSSTGRTYERDFSGHYGH